MGLCSDVTGELLSLSNLSACVGAWAVQSGIHVIVSVLCESLCTPDKVYPIDPLQNALRDSLLAYRWTDSVLLHTWNVCVFVCCCREVPLHMKKIAGRTMPLERHGALKSELFLKGDRLPLPTLVGGALLLL